MKVISVKLVSALQLFSYFYTWYKNNCRANSSLTNVTLIYWYVSKADYIVLSTGRCRTYEEQYEEHIHIYIGIAEILRDRLRETWTHT
jgi:hypothetical protein